MHESNITQDACEYLQYFLETALQYVDNYIELINVIQKFSYVKEDENGVKLGLEDQYKKTCEKLGEIIPPKFKREKSSKYIGLSQFNENADIFNQLPAFNEKIRLVALDIIKSIETARNRHAFDGKAIIGQFQAIIDNRKKSDFIEVLKHSRFENELSTIERIYLPSVDRLIENKKHEILKKYPEITPESSEKERLAIMEEINIKPIIDSVLSELDQFDIPDSIKEESIKRFNKHITDELDKYNKGLREDYMKHLKERQVKYLVPIILNFLQNFTFLASTKIMESKKTSVDRNQVQNIFNEMEKEIQKVIDESSKKYQLLNATKLEIPNLIQNKKEEITNRLATYANEVANNNKMAEEAEKQRKIERNKELGFAIIGFFKDLFITGLQYTPTVINAVKGNGMSNLNQPGLFYNPSYPGPPQYQFQSQIPYQGH